MMGLVGSVFLLFLVFFVVFFFLCVCPLNQESLEWPFLLALSVFSNIN